MMSRQKVLRLKLYIQHREGTMKTHHTTKRLFLGILFLGALFLCMAPAVSKAQSKDSAWSPRCKANAVLLEEINKLTGGWVCLTLNSGTIYCGKVMKTRDGLVHLAKVQDKKYSDVLVRISDISVLSARFKSKKKKNK
jgi:hypothetical protein